MSEAAKSTWFWAKLSSPSTEEDTCQLMFSPYSVAAWPTHCWMATPAKLDPVDLNRRGRRRLGRRARHETDEQLASTTWRPSCGRSSDERCPALPRLLDVSAVCHRRSERVRESCHPKRPLT